jgi:ArsR family transcriptional regulator, nickel/cobalt-responsive transcriptional repressor
MPERSCSYSLSVAHGRLRNADQLDPGFAGSVADTMQALATPSRVRILGRLRTGASGVNELADAVGMEASAVSHQLRLLRHLGFVVGRRDGHRVVYDLYDDHVAHLLDEAISHVEHLQLGLTGRSRQPEPIEVNA